MALRDLQLGANLVLPARLLSVRFSRSGGPGGQHVNKVETKVDLRLDLAGAETILGEVRTARIRSVLGARLDAEGKLRVVADSHRDQSRNIEEATVRLEQLLVAAMTVPRRRRKTRPTRGSQERRLASKRRRSDVKRQRGRPED